MNTTIQVPYYSESTDSGVPFLVFDLSQVNGHVNHSDLLHQITEGKNYTAHIEDDQLFITKAPTGASPITFVKGRLNALANGSDVTFEVRHTPETPELELNSRRSESQMARNQAVINSNDIHILYAIQKRVKAVIDEFNELAAEGPEAITQSTLYQMMNEQQQQGALNSFNQDPNSLLPSKPYIDPAIAGISSRAGFGQPTEFILEVGPLMGFHQARATGDQSHYEVLEQAVNAEIETRRNSGQKIDGVATAQIERPAQSAAIKAR